MVQAKASASAMTTRNSVAPTFRKIMSHSLLGTEKRIFPEARKAFESDKNSSVRHSAFNKERFQGVTSCLTFGAAKLASQRSNPDRKSTRLNSSHVSESRMPS